MRPAPRLLAFAALAALVGTIAVLSPRRASAVLGFRLPEALNSNAATDVERDQHPVAVPDGQGNWVAVWSSRVDLTGGTASDRDIHVSTSVDDGENWLKVRALNTNANTDNADDGTLSNGPRLATDRMGNWVCVWSTSANFDGNGVPDNDILHAHSTDRGLTWSDPEILNSNGFTDTVEDLAPVVETDGQGNWICVWESQDTLGGTIGPDSDILFSISTDAGVTWGDPRVANEGYAFVDEFADSGVTISEAGGTWVIAWHSLSRPDGTNGDDEDIFYVKSENAGTTWTQANYLKFSAPFDGTAARDFFPDVAGDGNDRWVAVWHSTDDFGFTVGNDTDIFYARSSDDATTWTFPAVLAPNVAQVDFTTDLVPSIATDRAGNWLVAWESFANVRGCGFDGDILAVRSSNNGANWTTPLWLNNNALSDEHADFTPRVVHDRRGKWMATWWSQEHVFNKPGDDFDILYATSTNLAAPPGNSVFMEDDFPDTFVTGQTFDGRVRFLNTGASDWNTESGIRLGRTTDSCVSTDTRFDLPPDALIQGNGLHYADFQVRAVAPLTTGTCTVQLRLLQENISFFGATARIEYEVVPRQARDAQFISNTIPEFLGGLRTVPFDLVVRNIGTETWTQAGAIKMAVTDDPCDLFAGSRINMPIGTEIPPDEEHVFSGNLKAIHENRVCSVSFRMLQEGVAFFGPTYTATVRVQRNAVENWGEYE